MKILGIETSCDETAAAVVQDGQFILSNVIASQVDIHSRYGGIVPEVASRQHLLAAIPIIQQALDQAHASWKDIDAIAVTNGPGLAGSLLVGVNIAKAIAIAQGLKLIGVNHLEGHIYANWLDSNIPKFPALCLIVSGGHTDLFLMRRHGEYEPVGRTRDDAAGEAFDKVSRILNLGYPGGPAIEKAAVKGDSSHYHLPRAWIKDSDDFSFSGLKTAVLHVAEEQCTPSYFDIAASFQEAVADVLVTKTVAAAKRLEALNIILCGGVAANRLLRLMMEKRSPIPVLIPRPILCTDNAAMIASCGYFHLLSGKISNCDLDVVPSKRLR
jgi:N6-L-threonylcarbamoyladenine synthase